jgi:hypothetical protein
MTFKAQDLYSPRRLVVTLGVSTTLGAVEWLGLGHPVGLLFGLVMGIVVLAVAPLPWLRILPWGVPRPVGQLAIRGAAVLALSAAVVLGGYAFYFGLQRLLGIAPNPLVRGAIPLLSDWTSVIASVPLFAAAGWGISRHMELERRLEVHDERELALRAALDEARLRAVQSRLDPHFLFNALNLVAELCRDEPEEAERCVVRLSKLLRVVLDQAEQPLVPLGRELDLCEDYLDLCRARFGDRLQVQIDRDPAAEGAWVPFLAVQVLCENGVRHGVERTPAGGEVHIASARDDDGVVVRVRSPGELRNPRPAGLGIETTRRRLALAFGGRARLNVRSTAEGSTTTAELALPYEVTDDR